VEKSFRSATSTTERRAESLDLVDSAELASANQPACDKKQTPPADDAKRHCALRGIGTEKIGIADLIISVERFRSYP
jgi:hypothetical protein